ncbi:MAG: Bax inhibitor-1/YccA family protein [Alphaproteobacteria bacterium]
MDYTKYNFATSKTETINIDQGLRSFMLQVYNYMAGALALTGLLAIIAASSESFMSMQYVMQNGRAVGVSGLGYLIMFAPLAIALFFSFGMARMSVENAKTLFWVYAATMGLSLSSIFLMYTGTSIARVFFITASVFGGMSLYGYTTKRDLTAFGSFLIMGLFGIIMASVVNIFLKSNGVQFAVSILSTLIFTGFTAYDTQRLKQVYYEVGSNGEATSKAALVGAFTLYLDFINLFMQLLRFFGDRKQD